MSIILGFNQKWLVPASFLFSFLCVNFLYADNFYSTNEYGSRAKQVGKIENGKIYSTNEYGSRATQVGKIENGKIYSTNEYGSRATQVGKYDGGSSTGAAAAAFILLL